MFKFTTHSNLSKFEKTPAWSKPLHFSKQQKINIQTVLGDDLKMIFHVKVRPCSFSDEDDSQQRIFNINSISSVWFSAMFYSLKNVVKFDIRSIICWDKAKVLYERKKWFEAFNEEIQ